VFAQHWPCRREALNNVVVCEALLYVGQFVLRTSARLEHRNTSDFPWYRPAAAFNENHAAVGGIEKNQAVHHSVDCEVAAVNRVLEALDHVSEKLVQVIGRLRCFVRCYN
jgi:hypothetical protein